MDDFIKISGQEKIQIICLGCGYDPTFFHLIDKMPQIDILYVDIDYPDLIDKKKLLISNLMNDLPKDRHEDYKLIGCDLADLKNLSKQFLKEGIKNDIPTLFISECVLTYMPNLDCQNLIGWIGENFSKCSILLYEQVLPNGEMTPFACTMLNHFDKLHSSLRNLHYYPTLKDQIDRFKSFGTFKSIEIMNMNSYWTHYVDIKSESDRIKKIEPFDEWEEWNLKLSHYFFLIASTDDRLSKDYGFIKFRNSLNKINGYVNSESLVKSIKDLNTSNYILNWSSERLFKETILQRRGFSLAVLDDRVFIDGGLFKIER
jgi:tRNA wybutosine-synthesizing protein 4